jgi:hypothetical protein
MRTLRLASLVFVCALVLASPAARAQGVVHHVSVGGHDQDPAGHTDANFSLVANQYSDGTSKGEYTDQFGQGQGGFHAEVNCVFVQGNEAWVSGIITSGTFAGVDLTGLPVITHVQDNGKSANDPPDAISFSFIGNAAPCTTAPPLALFPMTDGQVTVN